MCKHKNDKSKRKFKSGMQAIAACVRLSNTTGKPWRYYRCPGTEHFHVSKVRNKSGSSNGKTMGFDPKNRGSNP